VCTTRALHAAFCVGRYSGARFKNVDAPKEVVNGIYRSVAVALARGNADIVQANLTRSRLAEW